MKTNTVQICTVSLEEISPVPPVTIRDIISSSTSEIMLFFYSGPVE